MNAGCRRCGECCRYWELDIGKDPGLGNWLAYHGLQVTERHRSMRVRGESKCAHLHSSGNGFKCAIYERRPQVCRDFACIRAKESSPQDRGGS